MSTSKNPLKRNSEDIAWEYAILVDPNNLDKLKCKLCGKQCSGGVYRMKQHIANVKGNVIKCPNSSDEDKAKCKAALEQTKNKKKIKANEDEELRKEVHLVDEDDELQNLGTKKSPHHLGPIDKFASIIDLESSDPKKKRQQNINDTLFRERTNSVHQYLARWVYESGIPFHAIENDSFKRFVEALGQFGPGYHPPSQYMLREPLLKAEVERTKKSLQKQEEEWAKSGCSIMTDAWSDRKRRSIMNLCVNCKEGTTFLSSKEDSESSHTGEYIFQYVDKCIEEIGAKNVVQIVTDNASANMAAAVLLRDKRPNMFWTSCATHTINLMLEAIGQQAKFKGIIEKAKAFTIFIYAHHKTLALMRRFTQNKDIVRPGATRFATSFLTLQSLMDKQEKLRNMVTCNDWGEMKLSKTSKGKLTYSTILNIGFWNGVTLCLKVFEPLVKVLRLVDGDLKPSMGFLYGELKQAKELIKEAFNHVEAKFRPIIDIIDMKGKDRLDGPLHLTAYLLNPYYFYKDQSIQNDPLVTDAVIECVEKSYPDDFDMQHLVINQELLKYKTKEGGFGKTLAMMGCAKNDDSYDPVGWWSNYGNCTPNLQKMAMRILSLTTSSSGCERNWSTFEGIHTKKRNRLDSKRLNSLVYVQFNAKIINKKRRLKEKSVDVLIAQDATEAQDWIVEGANDQEVELNSGLTWGMVSEALGGDEFSEPRRSNRNVQVRELHDEDFESDNESEEGDEEGDLDSNL